MRIGQRVQYIGMDIPEMGMVHNDIYTVQDMADCGCKDSLHIDIGKPHLPGKKFSYCNKCFCKVNTGDYAFFHHRLFRELDEMPVDALLSEIFQDDLVQVEELTPELAESSFHPIFAP